MPEQREIYDQHAGHYQRLIEREDYQGNLLEAIQSLKRMEGLTLLDVGSGTGRFMRMLAPIAGQMVGLDLSLHMLRVAQAELLSESDGGWLLAAADNRSLPLPSDLVDVAIAGWSFGHATVWYQDRWQTEIASALSEMKRVVKPGGMAIIFETLGTGSEQPDAPTETLAAYYRYLEQEQGFSSQALQTDYRFASLSEAEELIRFFFGDEMGDEVVKRQWVVLPEWTGMWWWTKAANNPDR